MEMATAHARLPGYSRLHRFVLSPSGKSTQNRENGFA